MNFIPNEIILLIFENIILITDKRQFLRTCKLYNNITKKSILQYENNYKINNFAKINKYCVDKFTLELCHDKYFAMIPNSYINLRNGTLIVALSIFGGVEILRKIPGISGYLDTVSYYASLNGHLNILKWVCELDPFINYIISSNAAKGGHVHILEWYQMNGRMCDIRIFEDAALNGHSNIIEWGENNGYKFNVKTMLLILKMNKKK